MTRINYINKIETILNKCKVSEEAKICSIRYFRKAINNRYFEKLVFVNAVYGFGNYVHTKEKRANNEEEKSLAKECRIIMNKLDMYTNNTIKL